ncbi:MAG TPA: DUF5654 family protein [Patescibacteria group bacterium]|nr:DUF5654 family protein [Patescibacteria group bacterium]
MSENNTETEKKSLKIEILEKMAGLATAGFGLVAALAWNDAIKGLFTIIFPKAGSIIAQFGYAIIITIIIVLITIKLGKLVDFAKKQLADEKEKEELDKNLDKDKKK